MATPDPEQKKNKSWSDLSERARHAAAPEIDVTAPVLAALRARPALSPASLTLTDEIAAWFARRWFKPGLAALLLAVGGLAYGGNRSSDALSFLFEFTL
jgi:hypothetical protein